MTETVDHLGDAAVDETPPPEEGPEPAGVGGPGAGAAAGRGRTAVIVAVLTAVVALPITIAAVAVRTPRWYPLIDLAQIEMRVRDVGLAHPPLLGLGGRLFGLGTQGSHPGPISFYLLAPVYRLLGSSSWALVVSDTVLNVAVVAAAIWAGHRRMGLRGALLVAAGLAVLMRLYTPSVLVYPWNPYMPVLFWFLFLVCAWGVLCGDVVLLPVAVVAGTMCAQTHIPYVALVGGMSVVVAAGLVLTYRRHRGDRDARRRLLVWTGASAALAVLLWAPVFIEQLGGHPGNLAVLVDSFRHPTDVRITFREARELWLHHLDVFRLARGDSSLAGSATPGVVLLGLWAVAAAAGAWLRDRTLVALHVVVGAAALIGLVAISRIYGPAWYYLMLWGWGTATLAVLAVIATGAALVGRALARRDDPPARSLARLAWVPTAALAVVVAVPTLAAARRAPDTRETDMSLSDDLAHLVGPTVAAIDDGRTPDGRDGTLLVSWTDPYNLGGQGFGLLLELERRGYHVGSGAGYGLAVRDHRVIPEARADAELHLAVGEGAIDEAAGHPGAERLALFDPRTDAERATFAQGHADLVASFEASGLDELVPRIDRDFFGLATDPRLSPEQRTIMLGMGNIRPPLAVYAWDPTP